MKRFMILVAQALMFLAACQTTSTVPTKAQRAAIRIIKSQCVILYSRDASLLYARKIDEELSLNSIAYGDGFLSVYDFAYRGSRGNLYHNIASGEVICGSRHDRRPDVAFGPAPPVSWWDVETGFQPYVLSWEGYVEDFVGRMTTATANAAAPPFPNCRATTADATAATSTWMRARACGRRPAPAG